MKITTERLEDSKVKMTVEVPIEELQPTLDKAYRKLSGQVNIPGFRRGHVPRQILDQHIGRAYIIEEAVNEKLGEFYTQAVEAEELIPMAPPEIDVTETPSLTGKLEGQLVFVADIVCQPEFELPKVDGVELTVASAEVSTDDVEEELDKLRDRFSSLIGVDRAVEEGDFVSIDLVADIDGEEVESTSGVSYQQGSGNMISGLDETLLGMKEGDTMSFDTEFVGGEHAGEKGVATVTVNKVKVKELPEADDDFALMASEFDTIGELRQDLRAKLGLRNRDRQGNEAVEKLREYLLEITDVEAPQSVVEKQLADMPEDVDEEQKKNIEESIRTSVKTEIVMDKVARESDAKISEAELLETVMSISQMYGVEPSQLLQSQEQIAGVAAQLTQNKALVFLLDNVIVKDTDGNDVDLSDFIAEARKAGQSDDVEAATDEAADSAK